VDPIHPITPGPPTIRPAVLRVERVTRERDRPSKDAQQRQRRDPHEPEALPEPGDDEGSDDGGRPHIDVRV
jgi:hypothetical protein